MLKAYLVFAGDDYYPAGGWDDFKADVDTYKEAVEIARRAIEQGHSWTQIIHEKKAADSPQSGPDGELAKEWERAT